ncbi:MAG: Gfo/Idh/MocA family oxidoreductase [Candidatus Latescibacter sp.]|nr:Gfo/Idh/MocA family oxidoreductase [Candidatus Latescibacter sp.]
MDTIPRFFRHLLMLGIFLSLPGGATAQEKVFRIGIIGLDTSHVVMFTREINDPKNNYYCRVTVAFKGGSPDIPTSADRIEGYTRELRDSLGIEIVASIPELLRRVDGVLLESVDGRKHLEQVKQVFAAKKPVYIDKPMAGSLSEVIEIFRLAKENGVPCWSSSSLRYCPGIAGMRNNPSIGEVIGCDAFSPCSLEPHHPDLFWYGIHGVETLFTIMGTGCATVQRAQTKDTEYAVGVWKDGRIGTFRGIRSGRQDYGAYVFGSKGIGPSGGYVGSGPLTDVIIAFFKTGKIPVPPEETIEIYAFMAAADESKKLGGAPVSLEEVIKKAGK